MRSPNRRSENKKQVPINSAGFSRSGALCASWTDGDTAGTDANCGVGVVPPTVPIGAVIAVVEVQPRLNIDLGTGSVPLAGVATDETVKIIEAHSVRQKPPRGEQLEIAILFPCVPPPY
jgi:hypothetical protein